ncbi:unnamed protein product [Peniophora sp. CBMAI 1063]|nr:unnamed protein product [Peniophora sp. CBMAI 1063]
MPGKKEASPGVTRMSLSEDFDELIERLEGEVHRKHVHLAELSGSLLQALIAKETMAAELAEVRRARNEDLGRYERLRAIKNAFQSERDQMRLKKWDLERQLVQYRMQLDAKDREIAILKAKEIVLACLRSTGSTGQHPESHEGQTEEMLVNTSLEGDILSDSNSFGLTHEPVAVQSTEQCNKRPAEDTVNGDQARGAKRARRSGPNLVETDCIQNEAPPSLNQRMRHVPCLPEADIRNAGASEARWIKWGNVSRHFGWPASTFSAIKRGVDASGRDMKVPAIFTNIKTSPGLPRMPGERGTMICDWDTVSLEHMGKVNSLFVRAVTKSPFWYKYVGNFSLKRGDPVTPEEWRTMPEKTISDWAFVIANLRTPFNKCALERHARMASSHWDEHDRLQPPSDDDVASAMETLRALRRGDRLPEHLRVNEQTVAAALRAGIVTLDVVELHPVAYDVGLHKKLCDVQNGDAAEELRQSARAKPVRHG